MNPPWLLKQAANILLLVICLVSNPLSAQDSTSYKQLNQRIDSLESALKDTRSRMVTHSDFEGIFRSINEDDQEFTSDDRRSKRRALDSLFKAAVTKPGQLTFTGQFMNVFHWDGKTKSSINTSVATVDLFAISSFGQNSLVFINLQGVGGDGPGARFPTYSGFHAGAGSLQSEDGIDRITILEAWVEYTIGKASVTAGKIDLTNYFDPNSVANDEYSQFISNIFVNNASLAVPGNGPGITINTDIFSGFTLQLGIASKDNSGDGIFEDLFYIAQMSESFKVNDQEIGAVRGFAYLNSTASNDWGYGFTTDLRVIPKLYLFGRYGANRSALAGDYGIESCWSSGLQFRNFNLVSNWNLSLGFAYAETTGAVSAENSRFPEQMIESYVRLNIKKVFFLSPHYQQVWNALNIKDNNLSIFGLRTRVAF